MEDEFNDVMMEDEVAMEDEVTLPDLPPIERSSYGARRPSESSLDEAYGGNPSSDDPVFSSDDLPSASVDNYKPNAEGATKRKRMYRGPWWGEASDSKRKRADLETKEVDSGVWMNTDDDVAVDSSTAGDEVVNKDKPTSPAHPPSSCVTDPPSTVRKVFRGAEQLQPVPEARRRAKLIIDRCLDKNIEVVDLTNLGLETIPSSLLEPLRLLIKPPKFDGVPPSESLYSSFVPKLIVFLACNGLSTLPTELFKLDNLHDLSVRNNRIEEIPPSIKNLVKLEFLNIAGNRLKYLPWELLELMKTGSLKRCNPHPNHYYTLHPSSDVRKWFCRNPSLSDWGYTTAEFDDVAVVGSTAPILVAIGHVQFFDVEGNPAKKSAASTSSSIIPDESSPHATKAPSLLELSLRSFSRSSLCSRVTDSELKGCPDHVLRLIRNAREAKENGGRTCTVCRKNYVSPMAEWIEWWDCLPHEGNLQPRARPELRPLPFLRRGCSWFCVPDGDELLIEMTKRKERFGLCT